MVKDERDSSWYVVTKYIKMYDYPSIPGVRDPRLLKKRFRGFQSTTVRKRLIFINEGFDFKKIRYIDRLEKREVGVKDWSDYLSITN